MADARKQDLSLWLTATRDELLSKGSDTDFRRLLHDTLAFSSRIQEVRSGFASLLGLSGSQYTILISVGHLQGENGVGVNAVAEHLHLSGPFVTVEVNKLTEAGLVEKASDPSDGRRVRLKITAEATRRLRKLVPVQAPVNDALFSSLSKSEFNTFRKIMERLVVHGDEALALLEFHIRKTGTSLQG